MNPPRGAHTRRRLVIVDADMLAGWRRVDASLDQLHEAVRQLRAQEPETTVAVIGDPALKWALPESEHDRLELDITAGAIAFAPAGSVGGHTGFIARCVEKARQRGYDPVVLSDRSIPGAPLVRVRRVDGRWIFDLDTVVTPTVTAGSVGRRRRRG